MIQLEGPLHGLIAWIYQKKITNYYCLELSGYMDSWDEETKISLLVSSVPDSLSNNFIISFQK
jgi:hypothetical protein